MPGSYSSRLALGLLAPAISFAGLIQGRPSFSADDNDPNVHCVRTSWFDVCWFVFTNYVLHALSVRSLPGENVYASTVFKLCCLLIPYTGLRRGLSLISRATNFTSDDLQGAARANALCMVIRKNDWRPHAGDEIVGCHIEIQNSSTDPTTAPGEKMGGTGILQETETVESSNSSEIGTNKDEKGLSVSVKDTYSPPSCGGLVNRITRLMIETHRFQDKAPTNSILDHQNVKIQGRCELPPGYALSYIPKDMKIYPRIPYAENPIPRLFSIEPYSKTHLSSAHDFPRILFSITQTVSGAYALYKARGSQIERYGYAAFGLTVLPYIVVSIINFLGALVTSEYETVFVVHSSMMDEMITRGGIVDGVVGTIHPSTEAEGQISLVQMEEHVDTLGIKAVFHGPDNALRCHDPSNQSSKSELFSILPLTTPKPSKPRHFLCVWLSSLCFWAHKEPAPTKQPEKPPFVSTISIPSHPPFTRLPPPRIELYLKITCIILFLIAVATPYIIIGILSGFKPRKATGLQLNSTLTWLICGQVQGYIVGAVEKQSEKKSALKAFLVMFVCYGSYCLCGLVVVAQEMFEFGTCKAD